MQRRTIAPYLAVFAVGAAVVGLVAGRSERAEPLRAETTAPDTGTAESELDGYLRSAAGGLDTTALAAVRRALSRRAKGDAPGAAAALERAGAELPGLRDWVSLLAAEAAADSGDVAGVRALLAEGGNDLARERGWRTLLRAQRNAGDLSGARSTARHAASSAASPADRADAWLAAGRVALAARDTAEARGALRSALQTAPATASAVTAARTLTDLPGLAPLDKLWIGRVYLRQGNLKRGLDGIDAWLSAGAGTSALRDSLRLAEVRALLDGDELAAATTRGGRLAASAGSRAVAAEASLLAARATYRRGRTTAAKQALRAVAERYPAQPAAAEALYILADLAHDDGRLTEARSLYGRIVDTHPASEWAAQASMRLGGLALMAGKPAEAIRIFDASRRMHPTGTYFAQASYWSGRAHEAARDSATARLRYEDALRTDPVSYHAMRAADHLPAREWRDALGTAVPTPAMVAGLVRGAVVRLDALSALGLDSLADVEMGRLRADLSSQPGGLYALAEALRERGEVERSIAIGWQIRRLEPLVTERLLRILYPFPLQGEVVRQAQRHGLDPYLIAGLIRQESLFDPGAVSAVGAVGLMQLMPRTAKSLARAEGISRFRPARLHEPEVNLRLGTRYVAELLRAYDGRVVDMLSAYNAGAGRLARWRKQPEYRDQELFIERIPYRETRVYIRTVQQNARIYAALYPDAGTPSATASPSAR